jgi:hypothetical protein
MQIMTRGKQWLKHEKRQFDTFSFSTSISKGIYSNPAVEYFVPEASIPGLLRFIGVVENKRCVT